MPFQEELEQLERNGYEHQGGFLPCPAVGGDHDLEIWVTPTEKEAEVCKYCQTVDYR